MMKRVYIALMLLLAVPGARAQTTEAPRLYFTPQKIEATRQRAQNDRALADACRALYERTEQAIRANGRVDVQDLCFAYRMTGKPVYVERARETMMRACNRPHWTSEEMLRRDPPWNAEMSTAATASEMARLYDCFKDALSPEDRAFIRSRIFERGIEPVMADWVVSDTRIHSLNSMGHNWWAHIVYNTGVALLAFVDEDPRARRYIALIDELTASWFDFGGDQLQNKSKTYDRGGMYEAVGYASLSNNCYLDYRLAWTNVFPGKEPQRIEYLDQLARWYMDVGYPRSGPIYSLYFGDSNVTNNGVEVLKTLCRLGFQDPDMLWYLRAAHSGTGTPGAMDLVYPVDLSAAPALPSAPTSDYYAENGWGMLRDSWESNSTLLGVVSGHTWNHRHADANSFVLFHKGEYLIKDAGNSSYGNPLYPGYFFQSQAHNVVLFDGEGQPREQQYHGSMLDGELSNLLDIGSIRYLQANGTGPMAHILSRNFRHFVWIDDVILVIDDLKAHRHGLFEWLLHPQGESRKVGGDIVITNGDASVAVRPLFPETLIATGYDHDFPEKMKLVAHQGPIARDEQHTETYYSIVAPEKMRQTKGMMAILLKDSPQDTDLPTLERLTGHERIGVRIRHRGKVTDLYLNERADGRLMHLNSIAAFDGFETDAYLVGFTYPEGSAPTVANTERYFMAYGSFLRREGTLIYESQAKAYVALDYSRPVPAVAIEGQRTMISTIHPPAKYERVEWNGHTITPEYRGDRILFKTPEK